ncbi:MAG TPA: hypothetical protein VGF55_22610 [Gemmataceae bacterium]|jgi:hypothetical protein
MFKDDPAPAVDAPPRRRWRFWLLLVGTPLVLALLAGVGWLVRVNGGLSAAIADADRQDPRWRLEDIEADRFTPPPGHNAADTVAAVQRQKPTPWPDPTKDELFNDLPPEHELNDQQTAALKDEIVRAGPALAAARSMIDTPRGRHAISYAPNWIGTLLPLIQAHREVVVLLKYDVLDKAQAGDADGAVRSCHAAFHAGCSVGDEPFLISQLVRIACQAVAVNLLERTLAQGEPSEAVLAALQERLEAEEPAPLLLYGLRGERAGAHQLFENLRNGTVATASAAGMLGMNLPSALNYVVNFPGFLTSQHAGHLRFMNEMVEIAKLPPEQWAARLAEQNAKVNQLPVMAKLLVPAVDKVARACQRNHALLRCAVVMIAAERYRKAKGQWPATPDDLVKAGLLKAVPGDPFAAGQAIKFAKAADGLIVYSVGEDGVDNGGKLDKNPTKAGADYGLRLWDVAVRRQPPLPPKPADAAGAPGGAPGEPPPGAPRPPP